MPTVRASKGRLRKAVEEAVATYDPRAEARSVRKQLEHYEAKHRLTSAEFCRHYLAGELERSHEFAVWYGLCFASGIAKPLRPRP
jgi:phage baseplate assembly protein W